MFNKRGISAIVATVLIILITVSAVGILWAAVIPMIQTALDFSSLQGRVTILNQGYTAYDSTNKIAMVQVKRDVDEGVMNRIKITFDVEGNSHSSSVVAPESGGTKVYTFDMSEAGEPDSVSVAPIFVFGKREKEGDVTSEVDIPSTTLGEVGAVVYEVGRDYFGDMSCLDILNFDNSVGDGVYAIDPDGSGGEDPFEVYCDMTTDGGGWTLMIMSTGPHGANLFTTTTSNRDVANGKVGTDLTIDDGRWYSDIRWGASGAQSTSWSDVAHSTYNRRNTGTTDWFEAVGQGGDGFTPAVDYKCSWSDKYVSIEASDNAYYNDIFQPASWNIPNPPGGGSWDGILPSIHTTYTGSSVLSDTHNVGGIDCNPSDARTARIQLWVR